MNDPRIDALAPSAAIPAAVESGGTEGIAIVNIQERDRRHGRLRQALDEARRELVDPSRRNRLLHAPLTGKRPWCMAIVGHDADELFDMLHRQENFRGYAFQGCDEEEADQERQRGLINNYPTFASSRFVRPTPADDRRANKR
jgi:hypothetical protein